ncbi:MAG: S-layer homology domain-containing protein [Evtepia sp.]
MLLSVMVMGTGAASFTDQDEFSDNYAEAAEVLTGMGIIQGYDDGSFLPQRNINRAQVATMIYRAATGDVTDSKISQFVGEDLFDDVNADDWFAGYVNYCGNAEYIKGFTPDTFGPYKQVTGYQVLAMILRAVGYDENDEYTGDQWTLRVAATAREQGLLDNLNPDTNLAEPATRELVAQLIFEAIQIDTVRYSPAAGAYRPSTTPASSLGEQVFDLAVVNDNDVWGRPATIWYAESSTYWNGAVKNDGYQSDKDDLYATIEEEALATYTTAVKICDVADDLGIAEETFTTYTNGEVNEDTVKIDADATTDTIGAQGRLTEVYEDTIVYIDTFLAEVTGVTEVKYDADGHVAKDASLTLLVYANDAGQEIVLKDDTNYTYAEGDMLLVNAVTDGAGWHDAIATDGDKHVEFIGAAESFVGAQTYIRWNDNQHTVGGDVYNDALHFHLDAAGQDRTENFNWWLDQYGNLIGVTAIDRTNYAVLKDMTWTSGQAEATLLYMNGEEATVPVNTIDGNSYGAEFEHFWAVRADDATPVMAASTTGFFGDEARVSHDDVYNGVYDGFALYQVYTNDDGSVDLQGFEENTNDGLIIDYANRATLDVSGSEILNNGNVVAHVDASTQIVVNNGDGTYSTYTGTDALADFANRSIEVFWSIDNGFTQNVYIKSYVEQAAFGEHLFTTTKTVGHEVGNTDYYEMVVYVDGVERTIVTDADVMTTLVNNTGKLFHVRWDVFPMDFPSNLRPNDTYGYVTDVDLVNEALDGDGAGECNYLSGKVTVGTGAIIDQVTNHSYNLTSATQVIYNGNVTYTIENLKAAVDAGMGIWVVDNARDGISRNAAAIYIGTKLSSDASATVTATYGDPAISIQNPTTSVTTVNDVDGTRYVFTAPYGTTSASVTVDPNGTNAVAVANNNPAPSGITNWLDLVSEMPLTLTKGIPGAIWTIYVTAEDGVTQSVVQYNVTTVGEDQAKADQRAAALNGRTFELSVDVSDADSVKNAIIGALRTDLSAPYAEFEFDLSDYNIQGTGTQKLDNLDVKCIVNDASADTVINVILNYHNA